MASTPFTFTIIKQSPMPQFKLGAGHANELSALTLSQFF
jgi:hypothetical protein